MATLTADNTIHRLLHGIPRTTGINGVGGPVSRNTMTITSLPSVFGSGIFALDKSNGGGSDFTNRRYRTADRSPSICRFQLPYSSSHGVAETGSGNKLNNNGNGKHLNLSPPQHQPNSKSYTLPNSQHNYFRCSTDAAGAGNKNASTTNGRRSSSATGTVFDSGEELSAEDSTYFQGIYPDASPAEVERCLKNIILSQVNIIKKQQQQLASKDREIEKLESDNKALKKALRVLEKRCATTSGLTSSVEDADSNAGNESETISTAALTGEKSAHRPSDFAAVDANEIAEGKMNLKGTKADSKGEFAEINSSSSQRSTEARVDDLSTPSSKLEITAERTLSNNFCRMRRKEKRAMIDEKPAVDEGDESNTKRTRSGAVLLSSAAIEALKRRRRRRATATTSTVSPKQETVAPKPDVQTPGWHIVHVTSSGVLEGTENITDEAFAKRHQKCEVEERRVIRRDRMRQREEMLKQKLCTAKLAGRRGRSRVLHSQSAQPANAIETIKVEAVEVCDNLPPNALPGLPSSASTPPVVKRGRGRPPLKKTG